MEKTFKLIVGRCQFPGILQLLNFVICIDPLKIYCLEIFEI